MHATVDSWPHVSCHPQASMKYSIKRSNAERHCARLQRTFVSQTRVHVIKTMKGLKCAWFSPVSRFRPGFVLLKPCCLYVNGNEPRRSYALSRANPSSIGPPPLDTTHVGRTRRHCVCTYHHTGTAGSAHEALGVIMKPNKLAELGLMACTTVAARYLRMLHQQNASRLNCFSRGAAQSMRPVNRTRAVVSGPGRSGRAPPSVATVARPSSRDSSACRSACHASSDDASTSPSPDPCPFPVWVSSCHAARSDTIRVCDDRNAPAHDRCHLRFCM